MPHLVHLYLSYVDSDLIFISWTFLGTLLEISPVLYQPLESKYHIKKNSWVIYLHSWCGKHTGSSIKISCPNHWFFYLEAADTGTN